MSTPGHLSRSAGPRRLPAFTVLEVLVAMVCSAILISILYQTMAVVLETSTQVHTRLETQDERVVLRRMLHRDIQGITDEASLTFKDYGFTLKTGHNQLTGAPLTVKVTWAFSQGGIYRLEENADLDYESTMRVADLEEWDLEGYGDLEGKWLPLFSLTAGSDETDLQIKAMRLTLDFGEGGRFEIVEALPTEAPEL